MNHLSLTDYDNDSQLQPKYDYITSGYFIDNKTIHCENIPYINLGLK